MSSSDLRIYGLIGKHLSHSFSPDYFADKFNRENIDDAEYRLFELDEIGEYTSLLKQERISGLNVTIPYKESVIDLLDEIDSDAASIGAVNCIDFGENGTRGFNTDWIGFKDSLPKALDGDINALVLGTGGSSRAVAYALNELGIKFQTVSSSNKGDLSYEEIEDDIIADHKLIINTTPLGMWPAVSDYPSIPFRAISSEHLLYDLIYNPVETEFLKRGRDQGATIQNGLDMLEIQAEESWKIWNN